MENQHEATITLTYTQLFQIQNALANRISTKVTTTPYAEQDDHFHYVMEEMMEAYNLITEQVSHLVDTIEGEIVTEFVTNLDQTISEILK
jgi:hypothetical protein